MKSILEIENKNLNSEMILAICDLKFVTETQRSVGVLETNLGPVKNIRQ